MSITNGCSGHPRRTFILAGAAGALAAPWILSGAGAQLAVRPALLAIETFAGLAEAPCPGRSSTAQRNFGDNAFTCASQSSSAQVKPCTKIRLGLCVPVTRKLMATSL